MTDLYPELDELIHYIHAHIYEPLTLAQLSRYAAYSPFHFTRIFKQRLGLTPQHFISSLRLQKAKDLLLTTPFPIREIAEEIGQQSLGTFTTRFTQRVGMTPSVFRQSTMFADDHLHQLANLEQWPTPGIVSHIYPNLTGTIHSAYPFEGVILIGLFTKPIPEGLPKYGTLLRSLGDFCIPSIQPGTYYLMATSVAWGMESREFLLPHHTLRTRCKMPIFVKMSEPIPDQNVELYPPRIDDPPILISLSLLMKRFLNRPQ
ncbi:helix-turn-helix domain-containing protein [Paenibacillus terrigena]|uniref:helix-turn-helix domain-containing protein n=1 Tax=Paenibacillus terrigena TaxID=369333 RepID=UPI00039A03ED